MPEFNLLVCSKYHNWSPLAWHRQRDGISIDARFAISVESHLFSLNFSQISWDYGLLSLGKIGELKPLFNERTRKTAMTKAVGNYKDPVSAQVDKGETYWFCRCGLSKSQPWCDGSHKGSAFTPMEWQAPFSGEGRFCACKLSQRIPLCDDSHEDINE